MKQISLREHDKRATPKKGDLSKFLTSENLKIRNHVAGLLELKIPNIKYRQFEFYVEDSYDLEKKRKKSRTIFKVALVKKDTTVFIKFIETDTKTEVYFYYPFEQESLPYIEYADSITPLLPQIKKIFNKEINTTTLKRKISKKLQ